VAEAVAVQHLVDRGSDAVDAAVKFDAGLLGFGPQVGSGGNFNLFLLVDKVDDRRGGSETTDVDRGGERRKNSVSGEVADDAGRGDRICL
jgi:hypothetical protein